MTPAVIPDTFTAGPAHFEAATDWTRRRAYWDGHNFRVRHDGRPRGPIASWNLTVRRTLGGPDALHAFAGYLAEWDREHEEGRDVFITPRGRRLPIRRDVRGECVRYKGCRWNVYRDLCGRGPAISWQGTVIYGGAA